MTGPGEGLSPGECRTEDLGGRTVLDKAGDRPLEGVRHKKPLPCVGKWAAKETRDDDVDRPDARSCEAGTSVHTSSRRFDIQVQHPVEAPAVVGRFDQSPPDVRTRN